MLVRACEEALQAAGVAREGTTRVVVACSGGPDSMALLKVALVLLGPERVIAAHIDHGVRDGSARDAERVREHCRSMGIASRIERLVAPSSDEATLRALRYQALERVRAAEGAAVILVGHTRDDQAETVLFGLLRNGGLRSLAGMPQRNGLVLRPLLAVPRAEVHGYLERKGWPSWTDPTNAEPAYFRNRLRKELLPLIERRYVAGASRRLAKLAEEAQRLRFPDKARSLVRLGSSSDASKKGEAQPHERVPFEEGVGFERRPWMGGPVKQRSTHTALFDAEALRAPRIRTFRPGDRIRPFGRLQGRRKVSDVLGEARVPAKLRERWPLVVDEEGTVLWVCGILRSDRATVGPRTREVWIFSVDPPSRRH